MTNKTTEQQIEELEKENKNLKAKLDYVGDASYEKNLELKWQPIETAPKDGTAILVYEGDDIGVVLWRQQAFTNGEMEWCAQDCCDGVTIYKPTHWMPLPKRPIK